MTEKIARWAFGTATARVAGDTARFMNVAVKSGIVPLKIDRQGESLLFDRAGKAVPAAARGQSAHARACAAYRPARLAVRAAPRCGGRACCSAPCSASRCTAGFPAFIGASRSRARRRMPRARFLKRPRTAGVRRRITRGARRGAGLEPPPARAAEDLLGLDEHRRLFHHAERARRRRAGSGRRPQRRIRYCGEARRPCAVGHGRKRHGARRGRLRRGRGRGARLRHHGDRRPLAARSRCGTCSRTRVPRSWRRRGTRSRRAAPDAGIKAGDGHRHAARAVRARRARAARAFRRARFGDHRLQPRAAHAARHGAARGVENAAHRRV